MLLKLGDFLLANAESSQNSHIIENIISRVFTYGSTVNLGDAYILLTESSQYLQYRKHNTRSTFLHAFIKYGVTGGNVGSTRVLLLKSNHFI